MFILKEMIRGILLQMLIIGTFLFLPAGTFRWWQAWVLIGMFVLGSAITMLVVFPGREDLLRERMKSPLQKDQPLSDKIILLAYLLTFAGMLVVTGLDVCRFHWLPQPPLWLSFCGLALYVFGWVVISLVFAQNPFSAPVVKYQEERHHQVIDTGVYAIVRHPMYAATAPLTMGMTLWLGSWVGTLVAVFGMFLLALRIIGEEKFLTGNLPGYTDYQKRVRYRLIPFVW